MQKRQILHRIDQIFDYSLLVIAILIVLYITISTAYPHWKPEYSTVSEDIQTWFNSQHNGHGQYCCDQADGERYDGDYTINSDGSVKLANGTVIENWKVLTSPNPVGHPILWHIGSHVYCFALGPQI